MKLTHLKQFLTQVEQVQFKLPTGETVPAHFHLTEVGRIDKHFIDCGGVTRTSSVVNFQLYTAQDIDHRLSTAKLAKIIALSETQLELDDLEIEVEYQSDTIGKYGLAFDGSSFLLTAKHTDCLAADACGIPKEEPAKQSATCEPGSGCC
jgi:hypothetical protein